MFWNAKEMSTDSCSVMHGQGDNFPFSFLFCFFFLVCTELHYVKHPLQDARPALALLCFPHICFPKQ